MFYYYSLTIIQTNNLFIFRDLWNFTTKCIGVKLKLLVFFFVPLVMRKVQKVESIYYITEWLRNNEQKEYRLILCIYKHWKNTKRWRALIHRMIRKQRVKTEQIKRKTNLFCVFCKCVNSKKTSSKSFKRISNKIIIAIIERLLGKGTSQWSLHNNYGWSKTKDWQ